MLPTTSDPYDILGVPSSASDAEIKLAFRKKASFFHPDRNPDPSAPARFREAQAAFDLLNDPEQRAAHDARRQRHLLDDPALTARNMFAKYLEDLE